MLDRGHPAVVFFLYVVRGQSLEHQARNVRLNIIKKRSQRRRKMNNFRSVHHRHHHHHHYHHHRQRPFGLFLFTLHPDYAPQIPENIKCSEMQEGGVYYTAQTP